MGYLSGASPHIMSGAVAALSLLIHKDPSLCTSVPELMPSVLVLLQSKANEVIKVSMPQWRHCRLLLYYLLRLPWIFIVFGWAGCSGLRESLGVKLTSKRTSEIPGRYCQRSPPMVICLQESFPIKGMHYLVINCLLFSHNVKTSVFIFLSSFLFVVNSIVLYWQVRIIMEIVIRKCGSDSVKLVMPEKYMGFFKSVVEVIIIVQALPGLTLISLWLA